MKVLGIDPGFGRVGWAVLEGTAYRQQLTDCGCIETETKANFSVRLVAIYDQVRDLLSLHQVDLVAVESIYFANNQKTVIDVSQARGVILLAAIHTNTPLLEVTPLQVKQTVSGYGKASKDQVQTMVVRLLGLKAVPKPDDAADACAIAISGFSRNLP